MDCTFDTGWGGICGKASESDRCTEHQGMVCCSCNKPATQLCDHTGIQFVCGYPLCNECMHNAPKKGDAGLFALGGGHCDKKTAKANWDNYYQCEASSPPPAADADRR